jgi:flagellar biosynthetic protein FliR
MEFPLSILMQAIADLLLPVCRVGAMFTIMTGIGAKTLPARIRIALVVMFSIMIMPVLPPTDQINLFSLNVVVLILQQMMIGFAMGFISLMMINTFVQAGQILATQSGLGFSSLVDPASGINVPAVGQFYLILATLLFWVLDGHLVMIQMLVFSFTSLPINGQWWPVQNYWTVAEFGAWIFAASLSITLAPVVAMLVVNLALGVMTKAAPQLNIFSIGFAVTLLVGLLMVWLTMDNFTYHYQLHWDQGMDYTCRLIGC